MDGSAARLSTAAWDAGIDEPNCAKNSYASKRLFGLKMAINGLNSDRTMVLR